jgi:hypothetical protein
MLGKQSVRSALTFTSSRWPGQVEAAASLVAPSALWCACVGGVRGWEWRVGVAVGRLDPL